MGRQPDRRAHVVGEAAEDICDRVAVSLTAELCGHRVDSPIEARRRADRGRLGGTRQVEVFRCEVIHCGPNGRQVDHSQADAGMVGGGPLVAPAREARPAGSAQDPGSYGVDAGVVGDVASGEYEVE